MFYYYGRKKKLAKYYPVPIYDTIIEPFCGSAAYSLHGENWKKQVILIEKDERIYDIWNWLINKATEENILNIPDLIKGEYTENFLQILHCSSKHSFSYKKVKTTEIMMKNWNSNKKIMAKNLYKVKHWKIINDDYLNSPNLEATWFIDPPYFSEAGNGYYHSNKNINYNNLVNFVNSRQGEVICCDCEEANYLPFTELTELKGIGGKKSKEMIYYKK